MKDRKKIVAVILLLLLIVVAGVVIYMATRVSTEKPVAPTAPESKPQAATEVWTPVVDSCKLNLSVIPPAQTCTEQGQFTVTDQGSSTRVRVTASIGYTDVELRVTRTNGTTANVQSPTVSGSYVWEWSNVPISLSQISQIRFFIGVTAQNPGGIACGTWVPSSSGTLTANPNPVNIGVGITAGTSLISWTSQNNPNGNVCVKSDTATAYTLFASAGVGGSQPARWIAPSRSYNFRLFTATGCTGNLLAEVTVVGIGVTASPTATATPTPTLTLTPTPTDAPLVCNKTCGNNAQCPTGLFCSDGFCRNPGCPEKENCTCDDAPLVCNKTCGNDTQCPSGTICSNGFCRNPGCLSQQNCVCPTATPTRSGGTVTATPTSGLAQATATPTTTGRATVPEGGETAEPTELYDAGISLPGLVIFGGGLLMAIIGILLAL